uniref:Uncharacterized protein n=1 Tax=Oryza glumipatula TaxID=40148 RepID=A0A0E0B6J3_9ORYZ
MRKQEAEVLAFVGGGCDGSGPDFGSGSRSGSGSGSGSGIWSLSAKDVSSELLEAMRLLLLRLNILQDELNLLHCLREEVLPAAGHEHVRAEVEKVGHVVRYRLRALEKFHVNLVDGVFSHHAAHAKVSGDVPEDDTPIKGPTQAALYLRAAYLAQVLIEHPVAAPRREASRCDIRHGHELEQQLPDGLRKDVQRGGEAEEHVGDLHVDGVVVALAAGGEEHDGGDVKERRQQYVVGQGPQQVSLHLLLAVIFCHQGLALTATTLFLLELAAAVDCQPVDAGSSESPRLLGEAEHPNDEEQDG